jgi:8-oxo-dGTP pyrophosphatase MutT (NUDIX family)
MAKRRLAVSALVIDPRRGVLLVKQGRTRHHWELPGGKVKKKEELTDALQREVREETGITVVAEKLLGIFLIPEELFYDFVFVCRTVNNSASPKPNPPEIEAAEFFPIDKLPTPMQAFTRKRIRDGLDGKTHPLPITLSSAQWLD